MKTRTRRGLGAVAFIGSIAVGLAIQFTGRGISGFASWVSSLFVWHEVTIHWLMLTLGAATALGLLCWLVRAHAGSENLKKAKNLLRAMIPLGGLLIGVNPGFAQTWTLTSAPFTNWTSVASSADGSQLVASAYGFSSFGGSSPGPVFTSTNSGASWALVLPTNATMSSNYKLNWRSLASSADGTTLFAAGRPPGDVLYGVPLCVSTNGGARWTNTGAFTGVWESVATSGDGSKVVVASLYGGSYRSYISMDSGASWSLSSVTNAPYGAWSADGRTLVVAGSTLAVSTNAGVTWVIAGFTNVEWSSVAASADGTKLVAAGQMTYDQSGNTFPDLIYTSTDAGFTWTATSAPSNYWNAVASSADGTKLVAVVRHMNGGPIYRSADSGATWTSNGAPNAHWASVASSADGCKLVAVDAGYGTNRGGFYTWQTIPKPVLDVAPSGSNLLLSWTVASRLFGLQENVDLASTNWTDVASAPVLNLTNLQNQVRLPLPAGNRFYRLRVFVN
jgi:hypothetical protein